jgi:hypothetical protein
MLLWITAIAFFMCACGAVFYTTQLRKAKRPFFIVLSAIFALNMLVLSDCTGQMAIISAEASEMPMESAATTHALSSSPIQEPDMIMVSTMAPLIEEDAITFIIDITWSDELGLPASPGWSSYFMLTQDEILVDHEITDGKVATGTAIN